jgi:hypothetical protein
MKATKTPKIVKKQTTKKAPTPVAEVPGWAKRAAGRNTPAEMAAATPTDAAPVASDAPATPASATKPPRAPRATATTKPVKLKAAPKVDGLKPAAPGSLRAVGDGWLASLKAAGHTPSTISSYGNDLAIAYEHFGEGQAAEITEKQVAAFNASAGVIKTKHGKSKAQPTILKTRRALRLALVWAAGQKIIKAAPYAEKTTA